MRKKAIYQYVKLGIAAIGIGIISAVLLFSLKRITENSEHHLFTISQGNIFLSILFPFAGLSLIYFLRIHLFRRKENKGIKEVMEASIKKDAVLPFYKITSHYINGFLTIIFGGSTGIEVSSVVASSAVGSEVGRKMGILKKYRAALLGAGVAAAITTLFNSPLAGMFFAYEVIYKRISKPFFIITCVAAITAWLFNFMMQEKPLFDFTVNEWHSYAIPYFILLGIIAGINSVYLTKTVIFIKQLFSQIHRRYLGVLIGSTLIGLLIFFIPSVYGEGYSAIHHLLSFEKENPQMLILKILLILLLKPIATSLTLASGGDGGVFAPSLFIGAFLGFLVAFVLNNYFHAEVIPVNFMIVGMASVLGASIHAPFTSIFLVCGITGSFALFIPLLIGCLISRITAHFIFPYSVYNYSKQKHPLKL